MPKFHCYHCNQRIEVREVYAGQFFACPSCSKQIQVPATDTPLTSDLADDLEPTLTEFYFSFSGRISLADYWLKGILVGLAIGILGLIADASLEAHGVLYGFLVLFCLWPAAALNVKRWHDRNKSGWHYWVILIPLAGPIWSFIETLCLEGTRGENKYGPDPVRRKRSKHSNQRSALDQPPKTFSNHEHTPAVPPVQAHSYPPLPSQPKPAVMRLRGRDLQGCSYDVTFTLADFQIAGGILVIGRNAQLSQLLLSHDSVSRQHAAFTLTNGVVQVEDRNSGNGTSINGRQLRPGSPSFPIQPGDKLTLGEVDLIFEMTY